MITKNTFTNTYALLFYYAFAIFTVLCLIEPRNIIWGDAGHYWTISLDFVKDEKFAFSNFTNNLRSYVFPFILHIFFNVFKCLKDDHIFYIRLTNILLLSIGIAFAQIPFFELLFGKKINFVQGAVYITVFIFFWTDLLYYPMTDALAISIFMALVLLLERTKAQWFHAFIFGFLLMSLVYIRPIYACVFPFFVLYFLYKIYFSDRSLALKLMLSIAAFIGIFIIMLPQISINKKNFNVNSPALQTQNVYASQRGLYLQQLIWGTQYQKYDVQINNNYGNNSVLYDEPDGKAIFEREQMNSFLSYGDYIRVVLRNIPEYVLIYYRHIFNALDLRYNQIYIKDLYHRSALLAFFNYSFIFCCIIILMKKLLHFRWKNTFWFALLLMLPCIFIIPTVVENRFFLPVFSLMYIISILFFSDVKGLLIKKYWNIALLLSFCLFQYICFAMSDSAFQAIQNIKIIQ